MQEYIKTFKPQINVMLSEQTTENIITSLWNTLDKVYFTSKKSMILLFLLKKTRHSDYLTTISKITEYENYSDRGKELKSKKNN